METKQVKPKKKFYKRWWFWVIAIIVAIGALGSGGEENTDVAKDTPSTPVAADTTKPAEDKKDEPKKEESKITYENYSKITMGMKYDDVIKLLGEGSQLTSSEVAGIKTAMYTWNGDSLGSNMNVTIQNGTVTGKAQAFLTDMDAKVTLAKYDQVKEGMTYEQVKAVLGEGQVTSQGKIMDMETIIYSWINKDGANMNCTFTNNKMDMKAQFNLK